MVQRLLNILEARGLSDIPPDLLPVNLISLTPGFCQEGFPGTNDPVVNTGSSNPNHPGRREKQGPWEAAGPGRPNGQGQQSLTRTANGHTLPII